MKCKTLRVAALVLLALGACSHRAPAGAPGAVHLGMVTDVGGLGDKSFNDSAHQGLLDAQRELGAAIQVLQSKSAADYQPNLSALTSQHFDEIYAIGFLMNKDLDEIAKANPAQNYAIIDAVVDDPNVASITFKEEDGSFLAGALAAMVSKTHSVAFLGGQDIPLLRKFEAGFTAGARQIDAKTKVQVKYVGSFDDVASGKELANVLFDSGTDIIFAAAGKAGLGAIDAVKSRPHSYIIGVDSNQDDLAPGKILSSMVKRVDVAVLDVAKAAQAKKPMHGHVILGLREGGVSLTDFKYTRAAVGPYNLSMLDRIRREIISGRVVPPATREDAAAYKAVTL